MTKTYLTSTIGHPSGIWGYKSRSREGTSDLTELRTWLNTASCRDFLDTLLHDCEVHHQVFQWASLGGHFVKTLKLMVIY